MEVRVLSPMSGFPLGSLVSGGVPRAFGSNGQHGLSVGAPRTTGNKDSIVGRCTQGKA